MAPSVAVKVRFFVGLVVILFSYLPKSPAVSGRGDAGRPPSHKGSDEAQGRRTLLSSLLSWRLSSSPSPSSSPQQSRSFFDTLFRRRNSRSQVVMGSNFRTAPFCMFISSLLKKFGLLSSATLTPPPSPGAGHTHHYSRNIFFFASRWFSKLKMTRTSREPNILDTPSMTSLSITTIGAVLIPIVLRTLNIICIKYGVGVGVVLWVIQLLFSSFSSSLSSSFATGNETPHRSGTSKTSFTTKIKKLAFWRKWRNPKVPPSTTSSIAAGNYNYTGWIASPISRILQNLGICGCSTKGVCLVVLLCVSIVWLPSIRFLSFEPTNRSINCLSYVIPTNKTLSIFLTSISTLVPRLFGALNITSSRKVVGFVVIVLALITLLLRTTTCSIWCTSSIKPRALPHNLQLYVTSFSSFHQRSAESWLAHEEKRSPRSMILDSENAYIYYALYLNDAWRKSLLWFFFFSNGYPNQVMNPSERHDPREMCHEISVKVLFAKLRKNSDGLQDGTSVYGIQFKMIFFPS